MKKVIYCFTIAAIALSVMVGCNKKDPVNNPDNGGDSTGVDTLPIVSADFVITISNVSINGATVNVKPADEKKAFYWDVIEKSELESMSTAAGINSYMTDYVDYLNYLGYEVTIADFIVEGEDEYTFASCSPASDYVVWAAWYDEEKGEFVEPISFKEFTTEPLPAPVPSDNKISVAYNGDSLLVFTTTNNDDYYVEILPEEYYESYITSGKYTPASYLEEMLAYYTEYDEEYLSYFIFNGNYSYNFWADYQRSLTAGVYYALVAGISNFQVCTEVVEFQFTLPDLGVVSDEDLPELAPARNRKAIDIRNIKKNAPVVLKASRK